MEDQVSVMKCARRMIQVNGQKVKKAREADTTVSVRAGKASRRRCCLSQP